MVTKSAPSYPDSKNKRSYEDGIEFQDFVCEKMLSELGIAFTNYQSMKFQFASGENKQGIEIKLDKDITSTLNASIEIAERTRKDRVFVPSGIYRNDNSWLYIQGNYKIIFIFAKNILMLLHKSGRYKDEVPVKVPTIKRFLMPLDDAWKYAAKVIEFN